MAIDSDIDDFVLLLVLFARSISANSSSSISLKAVTIVFGTVVLLFAVALVAPGTSSDSGATASRTPRSASKSDKARLSMLSWTAVIGSILCCGGCIIVDVVDTAFVVASAPDAEDGAVDSTAADASIVMVAYDYEAVLYRRVVVCLIVGGLSFI